MRTFITKDDIDALLAKGDTELLCSPQVTVTDLAVEYARSRGMTVRRVEVKGSQAAGEVGGVSAGDHQGIAPAERDAVRAVVSAKLGTVPPGLDEAIDRVLRSM